MIQRYVEAVRDALLGLLSVVTAWATPLALLVGVLFVAGVVAFAFGREREELRWLEPRSLIGRLFGYGSVALVLVASYGALKATKPGAQHAFRHRDLAEATSNAVPDAPVVSQSGPAVAALTERTYTSTLTLPPSFLNRLNGEGLNVLAPYLADNSTQNVVRLRNSFKNRGRNVVFSREATVEEEKPIPLLSSLIKVSFSRLPKRAYDAQFEGRYRFANGGAKATKAHFVFSLPQAGTVRDLKIVVGTKTLAGPKTATEATGTATNSASQHAEDAGGADVGDPNVYEWKGVLAPGETREAVVSYRVIGARTWSYDLGSSRRRVEQFQLDAQANGDVAFARGSLQPTSVKSSNVNWSLSNVVTAQQLSMVFPSDEGARQLLLQSLSALPASLLLFFVGLIGGAAWLRISLSPLRLGVSLGLFALGLGASTVEPMGSWPVIALVVCPLAGALAVSMILGRRSFLISVPAALLPAAFLSGTHSGLIVLLGCALTLGALAFVAKREKLTL